MFTVHCAEYLPIPVNIEKSLSSDPPISASAVAGITTVTSARPDFLETVWGLTIHPELHAAIGFGARHRARTAGVMGVPSYPAHKFRVLPCCLVLSRACAPPIFTRRLELTGFFFFLLVVSPVCSRAFQMSSIKRLNGRRPSEFSTYYCI